MKESSSLERWDQAVARLNKVLVVVAALLAYVDLLALGVVKLMAADPNWTALSQLALQY